MLHYTYKHFYSLFSKWCNNTNSGVYLTLFLTVLLSSAFVSSSGQAGKNYQHWSDVDLAWNNNILSAQKADYFEGEVIPHVAIIPASNNTPLVQGTNYQFTVVYNFYQANTNAGGFAFMTTYNISRQPTAFGNITPAADPNGATGAGNQGVFHVGPGVDVISAAAPMTTGSSTKDQTVTITFKWTGATTTSGSAYIFYGLYIAEPGKVPSQGAGTTNGAHLWTGGSLQTTLNSTFTGGLSLQLAPSAIIAGAISGVKFKDLNNNGVKDAAEPLLPGWTIYLDNNNNGIKDAGEASTVTDVNGAYSFSVTPDANKLTAVNDPYYVREVQQNGYTQTLPNANTAGVTNVLSYGYGPLTVTALTPTYTNKDFGNFICANVTLTASGSPVSCYGGSNGSISGTVSGGAVPYTVTLKKGGQTQTTQQVITSGGSYSFTGLVAGTDYTVDAADNNGCTAAQQSPSVGGPSAALSLTASGTSVKCFGGSDGKIEGTVSGGSAPYSVTLKKGGVVQGSSQTVTTSAGAYSFTALAAGSDYTVIATDANGSTGGCTDTETPTVGGPSAAVALTASGTPVTCASGSDGKIDGTVSGGTAPYTVTLKKGTSTIGTQNVISDGGSYSFTTLVAGTDYTVSATDNYGSTGGCSDSKTASVAEGSSPGAPTVCIVYPSLCDPAKTGFKISFTGASVAVGNSYSIDNGAHWFATSVFCNVAPGSNPVMRVRNAAKCVSDATTCNDKDKVSPCTDDPICPDPPPTPIASKVQQTVAAQTIELAQQPTVKAAPNPYSDKVRFSVKSAVSGQGTLDLYNLLGQKVKTVFQGHVEAGQIQNFEYNVPNAQRSNLIYIFRVGDQRVSGKLLH